MLLHADADAFFASVAIRHRPDLRRRPAAVASHIVMSANYPARAHGVTGAMPVREALRRCPDLVLLEHDAEDQRVASAALMALFRRRARRVEPGSMEEAFLDPGPADPVSLAHEVRRAADTELGLPVSVGVGRTRLIAKLASRRAKPDGLLVVDPATEARWRAELTIADTWGAGPRTVDRLAEAGVGAIRELNGWDEARLAGIVGVAQARRLLAIRDGVDDATVRLLGPRRSVSASRTLAPASSHPAVVRRHLDLVTDVALDRLGAVQGMTHRIELGVRWVDGELASGRVGLPSATDDPTVLRRAVVALFGGGAVSPGLAAGRAVSLIGVTLGLAGVAASRDQPLLPITGGEGPGRPW